MNTQQLKDKILQMAIQGKLVKQDPKDEPAKELLKRIKEEKEQLIKDKKIKKTKDLPPVEDDEKPFDIPESWEWVRLRDATYNHGQKKPDNQFIYIDVGSIDNKNCCLSKEQTILEPNEAPSRARKLIQMGSVIYSTVRPYLMNIAIIDRDFELEPIVSTGFAVLHPYTVVGNRFLFYYVRSSSFNQFVSEQMVGMAYPAINETTLMTGLFPLPPLEEQQRIVEKIDQLFTLIDTLEGNKEEMLTAIKETRNKVLDEAIRGNLVEQNPDDEPAKELLKRIKEEKEQLIKDKKIKKTKELPPIENDEKPFDIPDSWEWVRLGEVTICRDGERIPLSSKVREDMEKVYDYYGASGVIDKVDSFIFQKPLLLIGEDGANLINRVTPVAFIAKGKYWVNNHAHVIDAPQYMTLQYLELFINSIDLKPYITGTAQPKLNQEKLNNILLSLPPLEEQQRIVEKIDEIMTICDDLENQLLN